MADVTAIRPEAKRAPEALGYISGCRLLSDLASIGFDVTLTVATRSERALGQVRKWSLAIEAGDLTPDEVRDIFARVEARGLTAQIGYAQQISVT